MIPSKDFEAVNAQTWEADTDVGSIPPSQITAELNRLTSQAIGECDSRHQDDTTPLRATNDDSHSFSRTAKLRDRVEPRRFVMGDRPSTLRSLEKISSKQRMGWAKASGLVTTRTLIDRDKKLSTEAEKRKYLDSPIPNENFPSSGYMLWQHQSDTPMDLFGLKLEDLNTIRTEHKVYIDWDDDTKCLRISSHSAFGDNIPHAIQAIRLEMQNAKARAISALPVYIVLPPPGTTMKARIVPIFSASEDHQIRGIITGFDLVAPGLTEAELNQWKLQERPWILRNNHQRIQDQLIKTALDLSVYRGWMRMRVHFGHLHLKQYRKDFAKSGYSFKDFAKMMKEPRITGTFERKISDAAIATKAMQKFVQSTELFLPAESRMEALKDVTPVHSEIIFVTIRGGQTLRVEADLDSMLDDKGNKTTGYQTGTVRLYHNNNRNKRFETTTIDIGSKLDWTLEIITDNSIQDIPLSIRSLIITSLPTTNVENVDNLGLIYPRVCPQIPNDLKVNEVVVRSVWKYMVQKSGYEVQISIYRTWNSCDTNRDPEMSCGVTMSHPVWDDEMQSIDHTTQERQWGNKLQNFFPGHGAEDLDGFDQFMDEISFIQGYLCDAASGPLV